MNGPDPNEKHPLTEFPRVGFLRPFAEGRKNVLVGRWTYYDDPDGPEHFFDRNVLHHYDFVGDRLVVGAFCAFATGVRFFMNGANHAMGGFSTFPFNIFGKGWDAGFDPASWNSESRGDTVVGSDVWIGTDALILPGSQIGSGSIIAARSVISGEVPPYSIVGGNPSRIIRPRFDPETVGTLLEIAWWDWPAERISSNLGAIRGSDLPALKQAANQ